jgi:hypothetical protein
MYIICREFPFRQVCFSSKIHSPFLYNLVPSISANSLYSFMKNYFSPINFTINSLLLFKDWQYSTFLLNLRDFFVILLFQIQSHWIPLADFNCLIFFLFLIQDELEWRKEGQGRVDFCVLSRFSISQRVPNLFVVPP